MRDGDEGQVGFHLISCTHQDSRFLSFCSPRTLTLAPGPPRPLTVSCLFVTNFSAADLFSPSAAAVCWNKSCQRASLTQRKLAPWPLVCCGCASRRATWQTRCTITYPPPTPTLPTPTRRPPVLYPELFPSHVLPTRSSCRVKVKRPLLNLLSGLLLFAVCSDPGSPPWWHYATLLKAHWGCDNELPYQEVKKNKQKPRMNLSRLCSIHPSFKN